MPLWVLIAVGLGSIVASVAVGQWAQRVIARHDGPSARADALAGKAVARAVLARGGAGRVDVTAGDVDCYVASLEWIQLADGRFERASASAAAVAAHEAAHAIQHTSGWRPFRISMFTRDLALLASVAFLPMLAAAAVADVPIVTWIVVADAGYVLLASLFTLWIEIDASRRAMDHLRVLGLPQGDLDAARKVLFACGATYATETIIDVGYFSRRSRGDDQDGAGSGPPTRRDDGEGGSGGSGSGGSGGSAGASGAGGVDGRSGSGSGGSGSSGSGGGFFGWSWFH